MSDPRLADLRKATFDALRPPPRLQLSTWAEANVILPASLSAEPGPMRLWPFQRAIADSIGASTVERVTVQKSARVGYSQTLVAAIGAFALNDPCPILCVLPADADCRHLMTQSIEPTFRESPTLRHALTENTGGRDTMLARQFIGGSLSLVSANSPRNLRAKTARVVIFDEVDAFEIDARGEGDPVALAEKRSLSFSNRKIVMGSTPVDEDTSRVCREYLKSDRRVFEVPCPHCGDFHEIQWKDIRWDDAKPETAAWCCPSCGCLTPESGKRAMVEAGRWRATRPEIQGHHGYKLNALVSLLPNCSWPLLAAEFIEAKKSPVTLKVFINTILGEPWRGEGDTLDEVSFAALQRPYDLKNLPPETVALTAGVDCQADRLELSTLAWTQNEEISVLAHEVVWGQPTEDATWQELDEILRRQFILPGGAPIYVRAAIVDSGNWSTEVYDFCRPRVNRRVIAGKGVSGFSKPLLSWGQSRSTRLAILGVDSLKQRIHSLLKHGDTLTFSNDLGPDYWDQINAEKLVTTYRRGFAHRQWEKISGRRNEALDTLAYGIAARQLLPAILTAPQSPKAGQQKVAKSKFLSAD